MKTALIFLAATAIVYGAATVPDMKKEVPKLLANLSDITGIPEDEVLKDLRIMLKAKNVFGLYKDARIDVPCVLCTEFMTLTANIINGTNSDWLILKLLAELCTLLEIEAEDVCDGLVYSQGPVLLYIVGETDVTPKIPEVCGNFLEQDCENSNGQEWLVELPDVEKPPLQEVPPPVEGSPSMKVLHFGDLHYDHSYVVGSEEQCGKPLCCRDTVEKPISPAGYWGDYNDCDAPYRLLLNLFEHVSSTHQDIDYILMTGDGPAHDIWRQTEEANLNATLETYSLIKQYFPNTPVYPVIGNHEIAPTNIYHPANEEVPIRFQNDWLVSAIWDEWTHWLPNELRNEEFRYVIEIVPGLKLIALQSNYMYILNWWNLLFDVDPAGQLAWLADELQAAEDAGDKVHLLFHHPPGADAPKTYSHNFWRIVNRYESTIRGMFAGHTHEDEFQIMFDGEDPHRAAQVVYVCPSGTPYSDINPAYRIYTIDGNYEGSSFAVLDHETWYMDLAEANSQESKFTPVWRKLYNAKEAYGMDSLQPQNWWELVQEMMENEETFNKYYSYWHRLCSEKPACEGSCRTERLCFTVRADYSSKYHCDLVPEY